MAEAVDLPIIADCDTGFGSAGNVGYMVRKYEAAGVSAVCIEDKRFPKSNSFTDGPQDLVSIAEFTDKLRSAKDAQRGSEFVVIARIEALIAGRSLLEALERACAYVEAGADAVLIHSKASTAIEVEAFALAWCSKAPVVVVPTTYFNVTASHLQNLGVRIVIYANHGLRAAIQAMAQVFSEILRSDSTAIVEERLASLADVFSLQRLL